jgi:hypothetical protein
MRERGNAGSTRRPALEIAGERHRSDAFSFVRRRMREQDSEPQRSRLIWVNYGEAQDAVWCDGIMSRAEQLGRSTEQFGNADPLLNGRHDSRGTGSLDDGGGGSLFCNCKSFATSRRSRLVWPAGSLRCTMWSKLLI